VDVPGHRDFIENMLAGIGGIDAALFVVAADEGVMPQTREHLSILDILQIEAGVVALTKTDLIEDPSWLDLVVDDLRAVLAGTVLEKAEIVPVSARNEEGLDILQWALEAALEMQPRRPYLGRPRLPIDRAFTVSGFGSVVTGTLVDGAFKVGDEVEVLPEGLSGRVRGLQTHKRKEDEALPGSRTAMNISGIDVDELRRGQVVVLPGTVKPTRRVDVHFRLLPDVSQALEHNMMVKLFMGAAEVQARVRLLGADVLKPGEEGWLQLESIEPIVALRNDRYILRRPSPGETLGGGVVLEPHAKRRHKRFAKAVLERLETLAAGTPEEVLAQSLMMLGAAAFQEAVENSHLEEGTALKAFAALVESGQALLLSGEPVQNNSFVAARGYWEGVKEKAQGEVRGNHQANPLRRGMPRQELKSRLGSENVEFKALMADLVGEVVLVEEGPMVYLPGHEVRFDLVQQKRVDDLLAQFAQNPLTPPSVKECLAAVGEPVYQALVDLGRLQPLSGEVVFRREDYEGLVGKVRAMIEKQGEVTLAQVRDELGTSRKYVQALLEYMDGEGITMRKGDARVLRG
jgi:selenocysteine-specific elongation factor